jgi:REP element-mobilizing transposase RayT
MTLYRGRYRIESTRLQSWDYRSPAWYFVTICTHRHACVFGDIADGRMRLNPLGQIAQSELENLSTHYSGVHVDAFVVMPNHVHGIVVSDAAHRFSLNPELPLSADGQSGLGRLPPQAGSLSAIVRSYKSGVTRKCRMEGWKGFAWQAGFYEHILRRNASVNAVREYIQNNPANWMQDKDHPNNPTHR